MRRDRLHTWGSQVASSASELPLKGSKNPRVILIEGSVSIYSLKRNKVTRFVIQKSQKRSRAHEPGEEQASIPGHEQAGDREQRSKHPLLLRWSGRRSAFRGLNHSDYLNRCPGKTKAGTCGGNPKLRYLSKCPDSGYELVIQ